jgi:predicted metal-dependent phosphoesterase TrpH
MIDLHTHSTASDGNLSPENLMEEAKRGGLIAIALTDHDTVAGIAAARARADILGLKFVAGVEIEIAFNPGEFHLLGLGIEPESGPLQRSMAELAIARAERNEKIAREIRLTGIEIDLDEISLQSGSSYIGRPHLADFLVKAKAAKDRQDAFNRFLKKGKPFYWPKECLDLDIAIEVIKKARGLPVVAHPYSLFVSKTRLASYMDEWKEMGIEGIEAYHPAAKPGQCKILEDMAVKRGFLITAGSDFHGKGRPDCGLGRTSGCVPIPDSRYDDFVSRLSSFRFSF